MAALVDLDLNCCPPSPEEPRLAVLAREQPFPDQMDQHKLYGNLWKQSSAAPSSLPSTHEHKLMSLDERGNPNPHVSSSYNKRKTHSNAAEQNFDASCSVLSKSDVAMLVKRDYHDQIDLEKAETSDDVSEIVVYSGFGNPANHTLRSQENSCCVWPENTSLEETGLLCKKPSSFRVSPGSIGSSGTPSCQSPIKERNTESRHTLIDLNEPQEESLHVYCAPPQKIYPPLFHSSTPRPGVFSTDSLQVFRKEVTSSTGSLEESSITVIVPNSAAGSLMNVAAASPFQRIGLIDLNVPLESTDMPSEIINSFTLHPIPTTHHINASQSKKFVPETLVDDHARPGPGISHDGPSNPQVTVSILRAEAEGDKVVANAAETLLSIFRHNSAHAADYLGSNSQISALDGNKEPQYSLDSYEEIVLNLEEVRDDGQSIPVIPSDKNAPTCGINLKRGRGMRNFQREIIPGLVSLARQDICDDLHAVGYEPKKTRSRKTVRGQGASSSRSRQRKRGAASRK